MNEETEKRDYRKELLGSLAAGIRQTRLISAAMAEHVYKETGYLPEPITKERLISQAEKEASQTIAADLEAGAISQGQADEARRAVAAWIAELRKAPDEIAAREREAIKKSLEAQGLQMPKEAER